MKRALMGAETEYALAGSNPSGKRFDRCRAMTRLIELACDAYPGVSDASGNGIFLPNGARLYVDAGQHPEYSTPELGDPGEVVRYVRAGDLTLARLARQLENESWIEDLWISRCNVDYAAVDTTWGCHVSYLVRHRPVELARSLLPHLASRIVYTGAGGFDTTSPRNACFTLSPRAHHLHCHVSDDSQGGRPLVHAKDEPLAGEGFHRLHLICGESLCSNLAAWLAVGTTAVVVAMIDAGIDPAPGLQLAAPLVAMKAFAGDPYCRTTVVSESPGRVSALDIQRIYLENARAALGELWMPVFAEEVCRRWGEVLRLLEDGPSAVADKLDWAIKYTLFSDRIQRAGMDWHMMGRWSRVAQRVAAEVVRRRGTSEDGGRRRLLILDGSLPSWVRNIIHQAGLPPGRWHDFRVLRAELCETDVRFGQLGPRGLFHRLDDAGVLDHEAPGVGRIAAAVSEPPATGRARIRGDIVRHLACEQVPSLCDWNCILNRDDEHMLDMSDPFGERVEWRTALATAGDYALFGSSWNVERIVRRRRLRSSMSG